MYLDEQTYICILKTADTVPPNFEIFVSPDNQDDSTQDGSETSPFEWFYNALRKANELGAPHAESTVTIYF